MKQQNNFLRQLTKNKYYSLSIMQEERARKITMIVFTLAALSFFGIFAISPTLSTISGLKRQLQDDQLVNTKLQEKIKNLSLLQQAYVQIEPNLPVITQAIPKIARIPYLVGQIQKIASLTNVDVNNLQVYQVELASRQANSQYTTFGFTFSVSGSAENSLQFFRLLSTFDRIITFDSLSFTKSDSNNDITEDIKGKAFFKN